MPSAEAKLTKKQKKAIAFRSRAKKTHATASEPQTETLPSPALEGEGQTDDKRLALEVGFMEEESPSDGSDVKGKGRVDRKVEPTKAQKRKRETSDDDGQGIKEQKKMKKEESALQGRKGRFILFVGKHKLSLCLSLSRINIF